MKLVESVFSFQVHLTTDFLQTPIRKPPTPRASSCRFASFPATNVSFGSARSEGHRHTVVPSWTYSAAALDDSSASAEALYTKRSIVEAPLLTISSVAHSRGLRPGYIRA